MAEFLVEERAVVATHVLDRFARVLAQRLADALRSLLQRLDYRIGHRQTPVTSVCRRASVCRETILPVHDVGRRSRFLANGGR